MSFLAGIGIALVNSIAQRLRLNAWCVSAAFLVLVAAVQVGLGWLAAALIGG